MRILICDLTGRLPRKVRWEAQHQLEYLGTRTRDVEAADINLHPVRLAGTQAVEAELTVRTTQTPIRVAEVAGDAAEAVERALQRLRSIRIDPVTARQGRLSWPS